MINSLGTFARLIACMAGLAMAAQPAQRVFVEAFTTKTDAEKLRNDLIAELRKPGGITIAASESEADLILGGGGEIWIKGYLSLNPRSGRQPSAGTPVYSGYLSVELRDKKGATLWSYLATPPAGSSDVAKDLSKAIAKQVAAAVEKTSAPPAPSVSPSQVRLKGAGATFPYPVYEKWFAGYRREHPGVDIAYDPVGSQAGVRKLLSGDVDFGASDSPQAVHELQPLDEDKYLFFPAVVGAVVPIVNLPGVTADIELTPEILAGVYLGTIRKWNDPRIVQANRGIRLPDLDIVVVHRSDGSGTSYAWTDFLSKTNPDWKTSVGAGLMPHWPVGRAASGNDGVASLVKELGGSIGYVEFIYALRNHLSYGRVRNAAGESVAASLESIGVAARESAGMGADLKVSIVNAPGAGAYPISSFTWFVVPATISDPEKRAALADFLKWMLGPGQTQAAALGYLPLPKNVLSLEIAAIAKIR